MKRLIKWQSTAHPPAPNHGWISEDELAEQHRKSDELMALMNKLKELKTMPEKQLSARLQKAFNEGDPNWAAYLNNESEPK